MIDGVWTHNSGQLEIWHRDWNLMELSATGRSLIRQWYDTAAKGLLLAWLGDLGKQLSAVGGIDDKGWVMNYSGYRQWPYTYILSGTGSCPI